MSENGSSKEAAVLIIYSITNSTTLPLNPTPNHSERKPITLHIALSTETVLGGQVWKVTGKDNVVFGFFVTANCI